MIAEPDVALTDYGLTILGAWLAWALPATAGSPAAWRVFFASISVAAAAGGTVHGFFPEDHGAAGTLLWRVALLAIGVTALAAWWIGAGLLGPTPARAVRGVAALALLLYAAVVLAVDDDFRVAIVYYLPATVFLLVVAGRAAWQGREGTAATALGLVVLLAGSWVQWRGLGLETLPLSHNALYHVIEALALLLLFLGARRLLASSGAIGVAAAHGRRRC